MTHNSGKYTAGIENSSDVFLDQILVNFIIPINNLLNHIWNLYQFIRLQFLLFVLFNFISCQNLYIPFSDTDFNSCMNLMQN